MPEGQDTFKLSYTLEPTTNGWRAGALLDGLEVMAIQKADFAGAAAWCLDHYKHSD